MRSTLRCIVAYVDFSFDGSLAELASLLSTRIFGGIEFGGENTGIWDEVPALKLQRQFLGMVVVLGGHQGNFGLEIESPDFPLAAVPAEGREQAFCEVSDYLAYLIERLPGIRRALNY